MLKYASMTLFVMFDVIQCFVNLTRSLFVLLYSFLDCGELVINVMRIGEEVEFIRGFQNQSHTLNF